MRDRKGGEEWTYFILDRLDIFSCPVLLIDPLDPGNTFSLPVLLLADSESEA